MRAYQRVGQAVAMAFCAITLPGLCAGCEMKLGGMTIDEAFEKDPKVAALVHAACEGRVDTAEELAGAGTNVNFVGFQGGTPLLWTLACRNLPGIEKLLQLGADPNYRLPTKASNYQGPEGEPLTVFIAAGDDPRMLELLLRHRGDPNAVYRGESALMSAAGAQQPANVRLLLEYGADIDFTSSPGRNAFGSAIATGRYDIAHLLLEQGFRVDLEQAARAAALVRIDQNSTQWSWKLKVLDKLRELGAHPPPPAETQPLPPNPYRIPKDPG